MAQQLRTTSMPAYANIEKKEITSKSASLIPGNPLKYLLVFVLAGRLSYLILSLIINN
jgi:hypothetical protein